MDTVVLDNKEYVKASVAAREFRYTSDYLGQLCREKKIDARLVGRTWFVNVDSIRSHRKRKYKIRNSSTPSEVAATEDRQLVRVPAPLKSKTVKSIHTPKQVHPDRTRKLRVFYELDDLSLIPTVAKKRTPRPRQITVKPAGAHLLKIKAESSQTAFTPTELPEVSLSGKLDVEAVAESEPSETLLTTDADEKLASESMLAEQATPTVFASTHQPSPTSKQKPTASRHTAPAATHKEPVKKLLALERVRKLHESPTALVVKPMQQPVQKTSLAMRLAPALIIVFAIVTGLVIISTASTTTISDSVNNSQLVIQIANLFSTITRDTPPQN